MSEFYKDDHQSHKAATPSGGLGPTMCGDNKSGFIQSSWKNITCKCCLKMGLKTDERKQVIERLKEFNDLHDLEEDIKISKDYLEMIENIERLQYKMENEGFDYCFREYSDFKEIKDKEFHKLRKKYCKIADELEDYVNNMVEENCEL